MRRVLTIAAVLLAIAVAGAAVLLLAVPGGDDAFTEAAAEATVERALRRCDHDMRSARRVECVQVSDGFACRADGRFIAAFDEPDPDQPEFSLVC